MMKRMIITFSMLASLLIANFAFPQGLENFEKVGSIYNYWNQVNDFIIVDDLAFVAADLAGLVILDISDPVNIQKTGFINVPGLVTGVSVFGDYAFLVVQNISDGIHLLPSYLCIVSIEDLENPVVIRNHDLEQYQTSIKISQGYAYLYGYRNLIDIIEITNPVNPDYIGCYETEGDIKDLELSGHTAYVADIETGMVIISFEDPDNPVQLGVCDTPLSIDKICLDENYAYIIDSSLDGIRIISFADNQNPQEIATYNRRINRPEDIVVSGDFVYIQGESLDIVSISDPENPVSAGSAYTSSHHCIQVSGNHAFLLNRRAGITVYSLIDQENPEYSGYYDQYGLVYDVRVINEFAFIACGAKGLRKVSVSDPHSPNEIAYFIQEDRPDFIYELFDYNNYIYTSYNPYIFSIIDPENTVFLGTSPIESPNDIKFRDGYAYTASVRGIFEIYSLEDPTNPVLLSSLQNPCDDVNNIEIYGDYAYIANGEGGIRIISISDPWNPIEVGNHNTPGDALDLAIYNDYLYIAESYYGIRIISISDPENPEYVGYCHLIDNVFNLEIENEYLFVGSFPQGNTVLSLADPESPLQIGYSNTSGVNENITLAENGLIYSANRVNIEIYRCLTIPAIEIVSDQIDFGEVAEGQDSLQTFTINNTSDVDLGIYNISTDSENYSVEFAGDLIIEAGSTSDVNVCFSPDSPGEFEGILTIESNDPFRESISIDLRGNGIDAEDVENYNQLFPEKIYLSDAYPNPFNSTARLTFGLTESGNVSIRVYDLLGREIAVLHDGYESRGHHTITWEAQDLPSGIYFIQMTTMDFMTTNKVTMLK